VTYQRRLGVHRLTQAELRQAFYSHSFILKRLHFLTLEQPFHTDRCDILAMYALDVAAIGGESLLASSGKIYNEIAATRPDVIHVLADDQWIFDEFVAQYTHAAILSSFQSFIEYTTNTIR
jgi:hypothetical protein